MSTLGFQNKKEMGWLAMYVDQRTAPSGGEHGAGQSIDMQRGCVLFHGRSLSPRYRCASHGFCSPKSMLSLDATDHKATHKNAWLQCLRNACAHAPLPPRAGHLWIPSSGGVLSPRLWPVLSAGRHCDRPGPVLRAPVYNVVTYLRSSCFSICASIAANSDERLM